MYLIAETKDYDSRKQQLEKNIYILTSLIQESVMTYLYYEAGYLAEIEQQMFRNTLLIMMGLSFIVILLIGFVLRRAFRFVEDITQPISKLCDHVSKVGQGQFNITSVMSTDYEIAHLDEGIQQMAKQIEKLLISVKEEETLQHKTELQLLQAQINPHFLYNTLDTIIWMVESGDNEVAIQMLTHLSTFFRTALSKGEDIISLEEEMAHTKSYLEIQQVRYRDILQYEMDWSKVLSTIRLPKLTLQPLVENALYHGIKEKRSIGHIKIYCSDLGENVRIVVEDDGVGIMPHQLKQIQASLEGDGKVGFGMAAVQRRLKLYFGSPYGMVVSSSNQEGVCITILIPKNIELNE